MSRLNAQTATDAGQDSSGQGGVAVWDPLVRIFHWSLVACFAAAWISAEMWDDFHELAGYCAAALLSFRLIWGLCGPRYARFRQFLRSPGEVLGYLADIVKGREKRYLGHNPAGGAMILLLLVAMAGTALTGWMYTLDQFWGAEWVEELHEGLATGLLWLAGLHVAGVVLASRRHGENLVRSMVNGRKRPAAAGDVA